MAPFIVLTDLISVSGGNASFREMQKNVERTVIWGNDCRAHKIQRNLPPSIDCLMHHQSSCSFAPGLTTCDLWHALDILASTSSIWNLCVISLDRYMAGVDPIGGLGARHCIQTHSNRGRGRGTKKNRKFFLIPQNHIHFKQHHFSPS